MLKPTPKIAKQIKTFSCPSCGAPIKVHAAGFTVSAVCAACTSVVDVNHPGLLLIQKVDKKIRDFRPIYLPLNSRGVIRGQLWEVIGILVRSDSTGHYSWTEYLLYSPYEGFCWLVENDGHWNFVKMIKDRPTGGSSPLKQTELTWSGREFKVFNRGNIKVQAVFGEFYWRVKSGDVSKSADFVSAPDMLSYEGDAEETIWSRGEYLESSEIKKGFQDLPLGLPYSRGIGPNQPTMASKHFQTILQYYGFFVVAAVVLQIVHLRRFQTNIVANYALTYDKASAENRKTTESFQILPGIKNLQAYVSAPVENTWFEAGINLIDDADGSLAEDLGTGVEFYSGYDDGRWTEGSQQNSTITSDIDPGKYHLVIEPVVPQYAEPYVNPYNSMSYNVQIFQDVPNASNFWWTILLLTLGPALLIWSRSSSEASRWSNSDFSPYATSGDDDE